MPAPNVEYSVKFSENLTESMLTDPKRLGIVAINGNLEACSAAVVETPTGRR